MINFKNANKFCRDDLSKIENYDKAIADNTRTWDLHHRLELTLEGDFALSRDQLKMHDMYYNRPYYELIFLTHADHARLHGMNVSEETRRKISEANKGRTFTEEWRRKLSEAAKNMSEEHRRKISESHKGEKNPMHGKHHTDETRRKMCESQKGEKNPLFGKHLSEDTRRKMSEAQKRSWKKRRKNLHG